MWKYAGTKECNELLQSFNLLDCKDANKYTRTLYAVSNSIKKNYRTFKIKKRDGGDRTVYEPFPLLKHIQRQILKNVLEERALSPYATAYRKGVSLLDNAAPHAGSETVLKLDIKDFFGSISFYDVYRHCFSIEYFPKSVGMLLTYLCTYDDSLPQGAPTSSCISNLVMKDFDERIGVFCKSRGITYTRYSDDMTFSGNFSPGEVTDEVTKELKKKGLRLNGAKTRIIRRSARQSVTGIVVNEKAQVSAEYRREIRKEMYYIKRFGIDSHLERCKSGLDRREYLNRLYGRISYVLQINKDDREFTEYKNALKNSFLNDI